MSPEVKTEAEDLNLHVRLCAERYNGIQKEFERVTQRMDKLESKVDGIHKEVLDGNKSLKSVIIGTTGTVVAGILGLILTLWLK